MTNWVNELYHMYAWQGREEVLMISILEFATFWCFVISLTHL